MKCPICSTEMKPGGIIAESTQVRWTPVEEFNKTGLKKLVMSGGIRIGISDRVFNETRLPNAYYCDVCKKVTGIFDIRPNNRR